MTHPALSESEVRILGCLMEKAVTTPDNYPLSLNAVVVACNQTTNRDPVLRYDDAEVERGLDSLREHGLVRRIKGAGQRVVKFRHVADEVFGIDRASLAVLGVLFLRGAQTAGELKARTERWHQFATISEVEGVIDRVSRDGLVQRIARRPGQKEDRFIHLFGAESASGGSDAGDQVGAAERGVSSPATAPLGRPEHSFEVRDPATGDVIRSVAIDDEREIASKLERARRAQVSWARLRFDERASVVERFRDLLAAEIEECARITTREVGKPIRESRNEIRAVAERIDWNLAHVAELTAPRTVTAAPDLEERVTYEPVGVVAHVSAWNYPYFVGLNSIIPAVLTGNAVLYKASEYATLTGLRLVDLFARAGMPIDVVQAVVGAGSTGAALVDADVDLVCFTGSYVTGRKVALAAAQRLARVQLELGGKDPAYVCDDVDVETAAAAVAEGAFYNAGQSCCAIERIYVHDEVFDRFVSAIGAIVHRYRVGDPFDEATDIGPLARPGQVALLAAHVDDAVARGARVLCGGHAIERPGNWFEPTLLVDVDHRMALMRDESFGPIVGVQRVRGDDEAVALMDETQYGLTAAVFTEDRERAESVLARLDVGTAYWNCSDRTCVRLPWAGRRNSGLGVSLAEAGLRSFVRERAWHLRPGA